MENMNKIDLRTILKEYVLLSIGTLIYTIAWTVFIEPAGLASGGLTGLCVILQYATGIPLGYTFPIINAILIIVGTLILGKGFGFKTIYVIALSSILFWLLPQIPGIAVHISHDGHTDLLLTALVGGTLEAIGIGTTLLYGGSTGGTDILAMVVNKYWPVSPGKVYLISDIAIVSLLLFIPGQSLHDGIVAVIYAFVIMITFSVVVDYVLLGNKSSVQLLIFSSKYAEIADYIIREMDRGVTALQSMGWYSKADSKVLVCVLRKRELNNLIKTIKLIDNKAFVSVSSVSSVYGEGFEEIKTGISKKNDKEPRN